MARNDSIWAQILAALQGGPLTRAQIGARLGTTDSAGAERLPLRRMRERGLVEVVKPGCSRKFAKWRALVDLSSTGTAGQESGEQAVRS